MNEEEVVVDGALRVLWCVTVDQDADHGPRPFATWSRLGEHMDQRHPNRQEIQVFITWEEIDTWRSDTCTTPTSSSTPTSETPSTTPTPTPTPGDTTLT